MRENQNVLLLIAGTMSNQSGVIEITANVELSSLPTMRGQMSFIPCLPRDLHSRRDISSEMSSLCQPSTPYQEQQSQPRSWSL